MSVSDDSACATYTNMSRNHPCACVRMRMCGRINVICSHALLRIEFTIAFRSSRAQIPTRNERAGREHNLRAAISSIKSILLALPAIPIACGFATRFQCNSLFFFFFFLNLDRPRTPIGRIRQRDKQELTTERLRRAFPMFNSRRALQRKCKR